MFALLAQTTLLERFKLDGIVTSGQKFLDDRGPEFAAKLLAGVVILFVGLWLSKAAAAILSRVLLGMKIDETLTKFLCRVAYAMIVALVAIAALGAIGVDTTAMAAVFAAAGLAVGLALQDSLSNFASGVMIILFRPFAAGDFIEAGGATGIVEEIHIFHTMMRTPDNVQLLVPNGKITGGNISNYSRKETRRIDLVVGCGYGDNLQTVKQFLSELVQNDLRILPEPAPIVAVHELAENSVNFVVRPWVANADYWSVRWDLTEAIKTGFDEHGFQIPFPQRDLHLYHADELATTASKPPASNTGTSPSNTGTSPKKPEPISSSTPTETPDDADQEDAGGSWFRPRRVG